MVDNESLKFAGCGLDRKMGLVKIYIHRLNKLSIETDKIGHNPWMFKRLVKISSVLPKLIQRLWIFMQHHISQHNSSLFVKSYREFSLFTTSLTTPKEA